MRRKYCIRLGLVLGVIIILPLIITNEYLQHILIMVMLYSILALSWNFIFGYTGQVSFGHHGFYALGAYSYALLTTRLGLSFWLATVLGLILTGLVAIAIGYPMLRLKGHYLAIATLGFGLSVYTIVHNWVDFTGGYNGLAAAPLSLGFALVKSPLAFYYFNLTWLLIAFYVFYTLVHSRVGRALRALKEDELAASALGVNTTRCKVLAFAISAVFAGLAGTLFASYVQFITPENFNISIMVRILTMVVVGGVATDVGPLLGAVVMTVLPEILYPVKEFELTIYGVILIVMLLLKPKGLIELLHFRSTKRKASKAKVPFPLEGEDSVLVKD